MRPPPRSGRRTCWSSGAAQPPATIPFRSFHLAARLARWVVFREGFPTSPRSARAGRPTCSAAMTASARPRRCFARPTGGASRRRPGFRRRFGTRRRRRLAAGSMPSAVSLSTGGDTDRIQAYDSGTGRASVIGHLAQGVDHASAVVLNGVIYLLGGRRSGAPSDRSLQWMQVPAPHLHPPAARALRGDRRRRRRGRGHRHRRSRRRAHAAAEAARVAIHDALTAPAVQGVSARIHFTNKLVDASSFEGADPILTGASGRLWASPDGHLRSSSRRLRRRQRRHPGALDGHRVMVYDSGSNTAYEGTLPCHDGSGRQRPATTSRPPSSRSREASPVRHAGSSGAADRRRRSARLHGARGAQARRRPPRWRRARLGRGARDAAARRRLRQGRQLAGARAEGDRHLLRRRPASIFDITPPPGAQVGRQPPPAGDGGRASSTGHRPGGRAASTSFPVSAPRRARRAAPERGAAHRERRGRRGARHLRGGPRRDRRDRAARRPRRARRRRAATRAS